MDDKDLTLQKQKEQFEKYRQRYLDNSRRIASKYLQELDTLAVAPKEFEYFKNILRKVFIDNEAVNKSENEKFIGVSCVLMPSEIIYALGARPINLCTNNYISANIGERLMPRDVCPLTKSIMGNVVGGISEVHNACDMFVVSITCDGKKSLINQLSKYKPTFPLYIPLDRTDDEKVDTFVSELRKTADKISEITNVKVTRESLAKQIKIHADVQKEIQLFLNLKRDNDCLIRGTQALTVMNTLCYDDLSSWGSHLKKLNEELLERKNTQKYLTKKKMPRILFAGSPISFPNIKVPLFIEQAGGIVVADETCNGDRQASDFTAVCDNSLKGYYRAIANKYLKPCSCPIFPDNVNYIRKLEKIVTNNRIDGIVYNVFRNCLTYDYEFNKIEKYFMDKGIPVIRLESDFNEEDGEQLRIRIEAFMEMIKFKNKRKED